MAKLKPGYVRARLAKNSPPRLFAHLDKVLNGGDEIPGGMPKMEAEQRPSIEIITESVETALIQKKEGEK